MIFPNPPDKKEQDLYLNTNKIFLYSFGSFSLFCLLFGMIKFSLIHPSLYVFLFFALLLTVYLGVSYFIGIFGKRFSVIDHIETVFINSDFLPTVDVYLPSAGEDIEVIANTFKWVSRLDWPKEKLNVYVLDDSGRVEVAGLSDHYRYNYISRPNRGELKKAGNIRYAFSRTSGDFILILDADFAPSSNMLRDLIPYFRDEKTAIVQSPQFFRVLSTQNWIEKGAGYIQELFYRLIQVSRNTWGASICVGTCAVYRRKALEPFGGTAPIAYSEDLHTGFMLLEKGWKVMYIPINLAAGLCPDNVSSFFTQQYRWCMGSTSLFMTKRFWTAPITMMQRLCYSSGMMYYVATAMGIFITPLPGLITVWFRPEYIHYYNLIFSVPSFIFGTLYMAMWTKAPFTFGALQARTVGYFAHAFALTDKLRGDLMPWVPTGGKQKTKKTKVAWYFILVHALLIFGLGVGGALVHMGSPFNYNFYPFLFFLTFHFVLQLRSLRNW